MVRFDRHLSFHVAAQSFFIISKFLYTFHSVWSGFGTYQPYEDASANRVRVHFFSLFKTEIAGSFSRNDYGQDIVDALSGADLILCQVVGNSREREPAANPFPMYSFFFSSFLRHRVADKK